VRNFRRHVDPPPFTDWELGLREAVHQALLREHHTDPGLRDQLLHAPLIGRQDVASPFGDIAVLARGQLYVTPEGFKFLQDSERDDCDVCPPGGRCARSHCQQWKNLGHHHKLLALWTVKRIRHRDPHHGHVFEIEYTVSPITSAISEELVKRHGYINYNVPGHIFVIKSANSAYHLNGNGGDDKWYKSQAGGQYPVDQRHNQDGFGSGHFKPGILIGVGPDGYKHVLHSFPGFYSSYHPQNTYNDQTTIDPKEYELYKKLIESLASKTTSHANVPHRFSATTDKTTAASPTYHLTTFLPVPQTTFVQFPDGQLVPLTENTLSPSTTPIRFPTTTDPQIIYSTEVPTPQSPKPITLPVTTIHYYMPVEESSKASTATTSQQTIATTPKSTTAKGDIDVFSVPVKHLATTTKKRTTKPTTTEEEEFDLFPINTSTEPMRPVTESPKETRPDSINEQLPSPDKDADTTVPYVSSTVTEPSSVKTERVTITRPVTRPVKSETTKKVTVATRPTETTTQKKLTTFVPSAREEITTATEKIPYTEEKTTVAWVPTTQQKTTITRVPTERQRSTTVVDNVYTVTAAVPTTGETSSTRQSTTLTGKVPPATTTSAIDRGTPTFTIISETVTPTQTTSIYTKPTTIFEYSFDSTTKGYTETLESTMNTLPPTYSTSGQIPTTQTVKYTIPTTTTHYFYTFETDLPKTSPITIEGTTQTVHSTQSETPTTNTQESTSTGDKSTVSTEAVLTERTEITKVPQVIATTTEDFLVDSDLKNKNTISDNKNDFDEDDIFGSLPKPSIEPMQTTTKRVHIQSDLARALFGGRRSKQIKISSKIVRKPVTSAPEIIYKDFYEPSTQGPTSTGSGTTKSYDTTARFDGTTEYRPSTDQSYSTSISVEVNKKNATSTNDILEPTIKAKLSEVKHRGNYKIYKAEIPQDANTAVKTTTERGKTETKKMFDDIALQLVNHARSIDYLHQKPSRQPKYRRRSYTTKRRSQRRYSNNNNN
jgi:hypothetical protein